MTAEQLIAELKKLPPKTEIRYAVPKGRGHTLYAINTVEPCHDTWALLKFRER